MDPMNSQRILKFIHVSEKAFSTMTAVTRFIITKTATKMKKMRKNAEEQFEVGVAIYFLFGGGKSSKAQPTTVWLKTGQVAVSLCGPQSHYKNIPFDYEWLPHLKNFTFTNCKQLHSCHDHKSTHQGCTLVLMAHMKTKKMDHI